MNPQTPRAPADGAAVGEMAGLVAAKDWARTPLGARETWSPSLELMVATILASQFPMAVRWGRDFIQIYNDGYRPILGEKHPDALGRPYREAWPETQPLLASLHEAILAGERGAFFSEDLALRIRRRGPEVEEAYFTISYSPIPTSARRRASVASSPPRSRPRAGSGWSGRCASSTRRWRRRSPSARASATGCGACPRT